jgi:hypothetical protein
MIPDALALKQENVLLVGPFPEGHPLIDPAAPGQLASGFRRCNIALVIAWPGFRTPYPAIARLLHRNRIPFSLILCGMPGESAAPRPDRITTPRALAAFFPLEDPSPCWRCLELRWLGQAAHVPAALSWLESLQFPELSGSRAPSAPRGVGKRGLQEASPPTEEERVMLSWTAMDVICDDAGTARVVAEDGTFTPHAFLPHPQCAWCSPWSGVKPHRPGTAVHVGSLTDPTLGIIRTAPHATLPRLDEVPPSGPDAVFLRALRKGGLETSASIHRVQVADGAPYFAEDDAWHGEIQRAHPGDMPAEVVLDALAVYALRLRAGRPLWRGTRRGVALPAPNPRDWIFPLIGGPRRFHDDMELDWARGHDLQSGEVLAIPADVVFNGPPRDGLACADVAHALAHPKLTVAVRWALSRVAENDALMATWYGGLPPPRVRLERLPAQYAEAMAEARRLGAEIEVLDLTTDIGVPVLAVVGRTADRWFYGCGAGMLPERALRAAWARLGQSYVRMHAPAGPAVDFLFQGPERDFPTPVPGGATDPIDTWRYLLDVRGMQALWIDITPPDVALADVVVARAWVAGAIPRPPSDVALDLDPDYVNESPGGARLLELPMRMGLSDAPLQPEDINSAPHPFH